MEIVKEFFGGAVKVLQPKVFKDSRGFFVESYNEKTFKGLGLNFEFIQDNHSFSLDAGTVRGIHFQDEPMAQDKLVRVIQGSAYDYILDLRNDSPTFGKVEKVYLSSENMIQILIPKGFGHGFCTTEDNTHFVYKVTNHYSNECNNGILWNDEELNIDWPKFDNYIVSDQDFKWPKFDNGKKYF